MFTWNNTKKYKWKWLIEEISNSENVQIIIVYAKFQVSTTRNVKILNLQYYKNEEKWEIQSMEKIKP